MAIIIKTLVTFVFTILFVVSSVHCDTIVTADAPGNSYICTIIFKYFD